MKILQTKDLDINALSFEDRENCYNALDCMITFEVFKKISEKRSEEHTSELQSH